MTNAAVHNTMMTSHTVRMLRKARLLKIRQKKHVTDALTRPSVKIPRSRKDNSIWESLLAVACCGAGIGWCCSYVFGCV